MGSSKKAAIMIVTTLLFAMIFSSIVSNGNTISIRTTKEIILKVAIQSDIKTLNLLDANDVWSRKVLDCVYDRLIRFHPSEGCRPCIASNWNIDTDDYKNFTVYLRNNTKWHDGHPLTADDIIFTYRFLSGVEKYRGDIRCLINPNGTIGVYKVNDHEVKFVLNITYVPFLEVTLGIPLLPMHIWNQFDNGDGTYDHSAALDWWPKQDQVIGCGPFKLEKWEPGQYTKLSAFQNYFQTPYIDEILFKIYKTADSAVMALKGGNVDYIAWSIPPDFIPDLMWFDTIGISSEHDRGFSYLGFNMRKRDFGYNSTGVDTGEPFRKAVAHCVDKKTSVTTLLQNFGMIADGPISPADTLWFNDSLPTYPLDVDKAKLILDNASITDTDGDGWRELPTIGDSYFEILYRHADYDPIKSATGLMIATQMQNAGIHVSCRPSICFDLLWLLEARDFDMYIFDYDIMTDDPYYLYNLFHSDGALNYQGYNNPHFDELIERANEELNVTKRVDLIKWCQGVVMNDLPIIPLYYKQSIEAYRRDKFIDWTAQYGTLFNYWSLINIHIPPTDQLISSISTTSAVISNGTADVTVTVRDQEGNTIKGAQIYLSTTNGAIIPNNGTTNIEGRFVATFYAPYVPPKSKGGETITVLITVTNAAKKWYSDAPPHTAMIFVKPALSKFLSVMISADYDLVISEGITYIDIWVRDQDNLRVDGATVNLNSEPANVILSPSNGTTIDGRVRITFTAPKVDNDSFFLITANVEKTGYEGGEQSIRIGVVATSIAVPPTSAIDVVLIFTAIGFAAILYSVLRKKRK
jgi:peptide/nickel transport system substrate-binding protein